MLHRDEEGSLSILIPSVEFLDEAQPCVLQPKAVRCIEPLKDNRWDDFVRRHPRASLFHSSAWLSALYRTYGYTPVAYTTSEPTEELQNAIVFCRVESWLTGRRLVSLPFSDHCEPVVDSKEDCILLSAALDRDMEREKWNYLELRPLQPFRLFSSYSHTPIAYAFHQLDLSPDIDVIFQNFHKSSTQRKVRRAERERLAYLEGSSQRLLDDFYRLFIQTRKRHGLAPQGKQWFRNLMDCFGDALKIRVALHENQAIAAILTIRHKETLTYKYGCSDTRFNNLGGTHLLFWKAIQDAKTSGLRTLDFGRTNIGQDGLITFKNRWGASQSVLTYSRYGLAEKSTHLCDLHSSKPKTRIAKCVFSLISPGVLPVIGEAVYKHIG